MTAAGPVLLTTTHAARLLRLTPRQVADLAAAGKLRSVRTPGLRHYRIPFDVVTAELARREAPTEPPLPPPLPVVDPRPPCRLCRWTADHAPADACPHCTLWTCRPCRVVHLAGLDWPEAS